MQRDDSDCHVCAGSDENCNCEVRWTDTDEYIKACEEEIHGVGGKVFAMDVWRNPDSDHKTVDLAEHKVKSLTLECYATTCNIPFIEKLAERSWYSKYETLAEARVSLHPLEPVSLVAVTPREEEIVTDKEEEASIDLTLDTCIWIAMVFITTAAVVFVVSVCKAKKVPNDSQQHRGLGGYSNLNEVISPQAGRSP